MEEPYTKTAADAEPKGVLYGVLLKVCLNDSSEGKKGELRKLEVLDSEGNENKGDAADDSGNEVNYRGDKTEEEPNDIAESFHRSSSFEKMFFWFGNRYELILTHLPFVVNS